MTHLTRRAFAASALALAAAPAAHAEEGEIRIGVIMSLTGPAASLGIPARATLEMWPKTIAGHKLNVTVLNDGSDPTAATTAMRKLTAEGIDVLVGPSVTPTSLAVMQVAQETGTPVLTLAGGGAIVEPMEGARRWMFKMPPSETIPLKMIFDDMLAKGQKSLAVVAIQNAYGQTFLDVAQAMAPKAGIAISAVERYNAQDTSVTAQALKIMAAKPDAVLIAAAGTPGATPHLELKRRGYAGTIYQTQAVANADFLRLGGKELDGALMPVSPLLVAEQLPASNPIRAVALPYVEKFEAQHGAKSRSLFGGMAWDAMLFLEDAVPKALKQAKPGTPAFRTALRDALETTKDLVASQGVYSLSPSDHNGADARSQVMVEIRNSDWHLKQ